MAIYCKGTARVRHKTTGHEYEIESGELDWEQVSGDERNMGTELHHEAVIDHTDLGNLSWSVWEYPAGIENLKECNLNGNILVQDFDYGLLPDND